MCTDDYPPFATKAAAPGTYAHYEDEHAPGWCAICGRAFPCPATLTRAEARAIAIRFKHAR